jgi:hypothetical protein
MIAGGPQVKVWNAGFQCIILFAGRYMIPFTSLCGQTFLGKKQGYNLTACVDLVVFLGKYDKGS